MKQKALIGAAVAVVAVGLIVLASNKSDDGTKPSPSPSASVSGHPTASPTASMSPSPSRTPVKTPTPTPTATPSPTPTPTPTPTTATVSFQAATYSVDEDEGPVVLTVVRTGSLAGTVTVEYSAAAGSAGADDYTTSHGTLTFDAGVATRTISVGITDDQMLENDETFMFNLSKPTGGRLGTAATTVTIVDDESNQ